MTDIITETLEDGTEYEFDMDVCSDMADEVIDDLFEKQDVIENFDFTAAIYSLFISSIHILTSNGWTETDLMNEVREHSTVDDNTTLQ